MKEKDMSIPEHDPPPLITISLDCVRCEGKGTIVDDWPTRANRAGEEQYISCPKCDGAGAMEIEICSGCRKKEYDCQCWFEREAELQDVQELVIGR